MNYRNAKRLNPGDKVIVKAWKDEPEHTVTAVEIKVDAYFVIVKCDDGKTYIHRHLKEIEEDQ